MLKVKIILAYDGSRFDGFAIQRGRSDVFTVSKKLYSAFKTLGIDRQFIASGRTDKGVHATYQVIDILICKHWKDRLEYLKKELNKKLKPYIFIKTIKEVKSDFHSRYDAKKRLYRYFVKIGEFSPFESSYVEFKKSLDIKKIQESIKLFEGEHDFSSFTKSGGSSKTFVRVMYKTRFYRYKDFYIFYFEANGFLRSQIRIMVDFLFKISDNKLSKEQLLLQLENRQIFSRTLANPAGLYLSKVKYTF